jgi:hypothetical protein
MLLHSGHWQTEIKNGEWHGWRYQITTGLKFFPLFRYHHLQIFIWGFLTILTLHFYKTTKKSEKEVLYSTPTCCKFATVMVVSLTFIFMVFNVLTLKKRIFFIHAESGR